MPRIILVEPNDTDRELVLRGLRRRGCDIQPAVADVSDVTEDVIRTVIAHAVEQQSDLLLVTLGPAADPVWDLLRALRRTPQTAAIPIVALSHQPAADRERAFGVGCVAVHGKPVDFGALMTALNNALATRTTLDMEPADTVDVPTSEAPGGAQRLLVVDDNSDNREILARFLRRRGYAVETANDGPGALAWLEQSAFDLILLDVMMPGMDGIEVLRRIRQTHPPAALPVIIATARRDSSDVVEALTAGANDYVTKPLDFDVVRARVENHLTIKRAFDDSAGNAHVQVISPGAVLEGRYELGRLLGSGGFARVHEGTQLSTGQQVAVKVLEGGEDEQMLVRFQREMMAIRRLKHPNIVRLIDSGDVRTGVATRRPYIVMDFVEGETLDARLKHGGPMSRTEAVDLMLPLASALAHAHAQQVVHRDVKPSNVILSRGEHGAVHPVLLDFGISRLTISGEQVTTSGNFVGTPRSIAPEQARGARGDERVDQYAFGLTLFRCMVGRSPFPPDISLLPLIHKIATGDLPLLTDFFPDEVDLGAVVRQAMANEPVDRYASMAHLGVALLPYASEGAAGRWRDGLEREAARIRP